MSTHRYTVEILQSGQRGPYQDTTRHVRVTIECFFAWLGDPKDKRSKWESNGAWKEDEVRKLLLSLRCGFTENTKPNWKPVLDWLKQTKPGVWEFHTTEPYTD